MAYDLEEQEQLAAIKAWWKQYGNVVMWVIIAALAVYTAWTLWGNYQNRQAAQASQLYYEMQQAVQANDNVRVQRIADDMQDKFKSTAYASMSGLIAARLAHDLKDVDSAKARLRWIAEHGKQDGYKSIARLRLAGMLMDEKAYDDARSVLNAPFPEAFASMAEERKGDVFYAEDRLDEARQAYRSALDKAADGDPGKALIQLKLDDLGGSSAAA